MRVTRLGMLAAALALACTTAPSPASSASTVSRQQLCDRVATLGGAEVWVDMPTLLTPTLIPGSALVGEMLYSGDSGFPCGTAQCCLLVPYFYSVECNGFSIALVPADRLDFSDEIDPTLVTQTMECGGNTNGSVTGGLMCRPDCNRSDHPSPTGRDVVAVRGRVPTSPSDYATGMRGRTTYVMTVHEVRVPAAPTDAGVSPPFDASCSPTNPQPGCPCTGFQSLPNCLTCTGARWEFLADCHGIG